MLKSTFAVVVLFVAGALAQSSFTINTPSNVVECQPTLITWTGGSPPYYLVRRAILFLGRGSTMRVPSRLRDPTGTAIESLGQQNSTSVTWVCNIASGTSLGLTLRDNTGATVQSAPFTVNPGSSTSCLNTTSIAAGPTAASSAGSGSTPAATSPSSSSQGSSASGTSAAASSTSTSSSTGAAMANAANLGVAGIIGAAAVALLL
ncbi:hypothetical protein EDD16DRAFT_1711696 [Pisolithus croceorrhizus]|nr:hypothetical protein EDD16DRAFT_1711696 [Pisolithus croceorrhizus]KAI6112179.1 hypothetical protein EV401DRAFT_1890522 [Pisolithus croceorrhizus]